MNIYATLTDLRRYVNIGDIESTSDDVLLVGLARNASRMIDDACMRRFYPLAETKYYDRSGARRLWLYDDLLAVTTLTNGDGTTIASTAYVLDPYNYTPKFQLRLLRSQGIVWQVSSTGDDERAISLAATWGYHNEWANAWASVDTVQDGAGISASVTSITVADADGVDEFGNTPRFQVGQLLKIESEYAWLTAINTTTNVLTVIRARNGTTGATHALTTAISIYRPMRDIVQAGLRLAKWLYIQRQGNSDADRPAITADGTKLLPMRLPEDVAVMLNPYVRSIG